jgi:hypothetical protein
MKEMDTCLGERKPFVEKLTTCGRSARVCLQSLDLSAHPEVQPFVQTDGSIANNLPHNVAADVIYRTDVGTQFQVLPDFADPPPPTPTPPPVPLPAHQICAVVPPPAHYVYCIICTAFAACTVTTVCRVSIACASTNSLIIQFG